MQPNLPGDNDIAEHEEEIENPSNLKRTVSESLVFEDEKAKLQREKTKGVGVRKLGVKYVPEDDFDSVDDFFSSDLGKTD